MKGAWELKYIVGLVFLVLLVILGLAIYMRTTNTVHGAVSFSACENGGSIESHGMCIKPGMTCPSPNDFNIGEQLQGCPSDTIRNNFRGNNEYQDYTQCCIVDSCSDVKSEGKSVRKEACFTDECKKNKELDVIEGETINERMQACLGFAGECTKAEGCCCVKNG